MRRHLYVHDRQSAFGTRALVASAPYDPQEYGAADPGGEAQDTQDDGHDANFETTVPMMCAEAAEDDCHGRDDDAGLEDDERDQGANVPPGRARQCVASG